MLILYFFLFSLANNYKNGKFKVLAIRNTNYDLVTNLNGTIRSRNSGLPVAQTDKTVINLINYKSSKYLIQFSNNRYLCGKRGNAGVITCKDPKDTYAHWLIGTRGKLGLSVYLSNGLCLIKAAYDKRAAYKGNRLNTKKCKYNDNYVYMWKFIDVDFPEEVSSEESEAVSAKEEKKSSEKDSTEKDSNDKPDESFKVKNAFGIENQHIDINRINFIFGVNSDDHDHIYGPFNEDSKVKIHLQKGRIP